MIYVISEADDITAPVKIGTTHGPANPGVVQQRLDALQTSTWRPLAVIAMECPHRERDRRRRRRKRDQRLYGCPREQPKPRPRDRFKRLRAAIDNVTGAVDHAGACRCRICHLRNEAESLRPEKCWCAKWQKPGSRLKHNTKATCAICAAGKAHKHVHYDYAMDDHTQSTREWLTSRTGKSRRVSVQRILRRR